MAGKKKAIVPRKIGSAIGKEMPNVIRPGFFDAVANIIRAAHKKAVRTINKAMVEAYWNVGRMIVEEEQKGRDRAEYGQALLANLSLRLTNDFGSGFSERNLRNFRQFYLYFPIRHTVCAESPLLAKKKGTVESKSPQIRHALRDELTWSHYRVILRVEKAETRFWYMSEAAEQNWSVRVLERQINSLCYERLHLSRNKKAALKEMQDKTSVSISTPQDFIKDPYVLEFLGLKDNSDFRESDLEQAIIGKLQAFMLELGRGFAFVARQQRISTETKDFFVDLVFYNYLLKCFVLIDLKTGELTHQDIGQMDMYVRLYEDKYKSKDDNATIGIILCTDKDETVVKYSVLKESKQLFASKYRLYLPSEQELIEEIDREKAMIVREREARYGILSGESSR
jgi:predicted nuclease of restriction endonuclease-like (RecB) superfamily